MLICESLDTSVIFIVSLMSFWIVLVYRFNLIFQLSSLIPPNIGHSGLEMLGGLYCVESLQTSSDVEMWKGIQIWGGHVSGAQCRGMGFISCMSPVTYSHWEQTKKSWSKTKCMTSFSAIRSWYSSIACVYRWFKKRPPSGCFAGSSVMQPWIQLGMTLPIFNR